MFSNLFFYFIVSIFVYAKNLRLLNIKTDGWHLLKFLQRKNIE